MGERGSLEDGEGTEAKLRGAVMSQAMTTIRDRWGEEAYRAALESLDAADREVLEGPLLASNFYPIGTWDRFLDAAYEEVNRRTGETIEEFYAQLVQLGGGRMLQAIYKMFLGIMRPVTVAKLIPSFWNRLYTRGELQLTVNEPGRCVFVFEDQGSDFRKNLVNHLGPGVQLLLGKNGARNVVTELTRDELGPDGLTLELTATYEASPALLD